MATVRRSIGTKSQFSTGTISIDATGLIVTFTNTLDANWGEGDELVIDTGGTPETRWVLSRDGDNQITLQTASTRTSESGLSFTLDRAYSTLTGWESGEERNLVSGQEIAKGVVYADSVFDEGLVIDGWQVSSSYYVDLTSAVIDRGDGTEGSGVICRRTSSATLETTLQSDEDFTKFSWLEIDGSLNTHGWGNGITINNEGNEVFNCIIHSFTSTTSDGIVCATGSQADAQKIYNCFLYTLNDGGSGSGGIRSTYGTAEVSCYNNTIYNCGSYGISSSCLAHTVKNNIILGSGIQDYYATSGSYDMDGDYNMSSDGSAVGDDISAGTATSGTDANTLIDSGATFQTDGVAIGDFVNNDTRTKFAKVLSVDSQIQLTLDRDITGQASGDAYSVNNSCYYAVTSDIITDTGLGSENLFKKSTADGIDDGTDLSSEGGFSDDIIGTSRPKGSAWDMGGDELIPLQDLRKTVNDGVVTKLVNDGVVTKLVEV